MQGPYWISAGAIVGSLVATIAGCTASEPAPDFHSVHAAARLAAIRQAADTRDSSKVGELISRLDSDDPAERLLSIRALELITGQTLGYDHSGPKSEREAAVGRWVAWYAAPAVKPGPGEVSESVGAGSRG